MVIVIIALLVSLLLPALKNARRNARMAVCMSNMRQMNLGQHLYAQEVKSLIPTFNRFPTAGQSWLGSAGVQAQDIVRRQTGRTLGLVPNRYFHRNYWHLIMIDGGYFGGESSSMFSPSVACPEDMTILFWKRNFNNPSALLTGMASDGAVNYEQYRPFWSSYQMAPASWTYDQRTNGRNTVAQIPEYHHLFTEGGVATGAGAMLPLGTRKMDEVSFPSNKVALFDLYDRHRARQMTWYAYPFVRQPLVFFDNSVRLMRTGDSQLGYNPNNPTQLMTMTYNPATGWLLYDPPIPPGWTNQVNGYYRWTKGGLKGYDFSGIKSGSTN